jgi:hypothetical protein
LHYDDWEFSLSDVISRRAISVENSEGDLHLWWSGIKTRTPHSFEIYMILT